MNETDNWQFVRVRLASKCKKSEMLFSGLNWKIALGSCDRSHLFCSEKVSACENRLFFDTIVDM